CYDAMMVRPSFFDGRNPQLQVASSQRNRCSIMSTRTGTRSIGYSLSIGLVVLTIPPHSLAHAQSADLVLCDRIAADPADPDKPADVKGVSEIAASDVATAIKFCKQAAPSSRRAMFALGRAYAANRQTSDAIAAWRKAADKGS